MYSCDVCEYKSRRQFNVVRHRQIVHGKEESETGSEMSVSETDTSRSSDLGTETDVSEESMDVDETEASEESSDEETDPWEPLVQTTFKLHQEDYQELVDELEREGHERPEAEAIAENKMRPLYRQELGDRYLNIILKHREMNRDLVHRKIRSTARRLKDEEEYEPMEA